MASSILRQPATRRVVFAPFGLTEPPTEGPAEVADPAPDPDVIRAEAEKVGYAAGYSRGLEEGRRLLREQSERLRALIDSSVHDAEGAVVALESDLVDLAMTVAGRVVERELAARPDIVVDVAREALLAAGSVKLIRVRAHPDDQEVLGGVWDRVVPAGITVELVPDPQVQRGGVVVDTTSGFVDAQPAVRFDEIRHQIVSRLGVTL